MSLSFSASTSNVFFQSIRQDAFYHAVPLDDDWYNIDKDVVNGKIISVGGDKEDVVAKGQGDNLGGQDEGKCSIEELFDPL